MKKEVLAAVEVAEAASAAVVLEAEDLAVVRRIIVVPAVLAVPCSGARVIMVMAAVAWAACWA